MTELEELTAKATSLGIEVKEEWSAKYIKRLISIAEKATPEEQAQKKELAEQVQATSDIIAHEAKKTADKIDAARDEEAANTLKLEQQLKEAKEKMAAMEAEQEQRVRDAEMSKAEKRVTVTLKNNYRPIGEYKVIGDAPGPVFPGVGQEGKLWSGTTVELDAKEARDLVNNTIIERRRYTKDNGDRAFKHVKVKRPLAEVNIDALI